MSSSTLYTVGTALNSARTHHTAARVLVAGRWIDGLVLDLDGHGVILQTNQEHSVVRIEDVSAVQIYSPAPDRSTIELAVFDEAAN